MNAIEIPDEWWAGVPETQYLDQLCPHSHQYNGHPVSLRYVKTGQCVDCAAMQAKAHRERRNERDRRRREKFRLLHNIKRGRPPIPEDLKFPELPKLPDFRHDSEIQADLQIAQQALAAFLRRKKSGRIVKAVMVGDVWTAKTVAEKCRVSVPLASRVLLQLWQAGLMERTSQVVGKSRYKFYRPTELFRTLHQ